MRLVWRNLYGKLFGHQPFSANKLIFSTYKTKTYSRIPRGALQILNYNLMHVDNNIPEAVVKHPGLAYADYDVTGQPKVWKVLKLLESIRFYAHHYPLDDTGNTFRDYAKMSNDCLIFLITSEVILNKEIYDISVQRNWLKTKITGGYVGKTSINSLTNILTEDGKTVLASNINHIVCVDKQSRRPKEFPLWWREKYSESGQQHAPLTYDKFEKPEKTCSYQTNVAWSDTDLNMHANWTSYVRFALDAAHHCARDGSLQNFEDNFTNGLHKTQMYFYGESVEGDILTLHVWEDVHDRKVLNVDIFNKGSSICQLKLIFH